MEENTRKGNPSAIFEMKGMETFPFLQGCQKRYVCLLHITQRGGGRAARGGRRGRDGGAQGSSEKTQNRNNVSFYLGR